MVPIDKRGSELIADIDTADPPHGQGVFWWLGQHSFIVKAGGKTIYLDPFLDPWDSRQTPPLLSYEDINNADLVTVSHDHGDHLSPDTLRSIARLSPRARFIGPRAAARRIEDDAGVPAERLHPLSAGEVAELAGVRVTAIKSKHESFDEDPALGFPYLGYVIEAGGVTLYHAGDTIAYEGLLTNLQAWPRLDVLFLPINGRDAERFLAGCIGNMTFQEAAELAGELRPGLVVPAHYDMFVGNQEDPGRFVRFLRAKYPEVPSWVGPAGLGIPFPPTPRHERDTAPF